MWSSLKGKDEWVKLDLSDCAASTRSNRSADGVVRVVKLLLDAGARTDDKNENGKSALMLAALKVRRVISLLMQF